MLKPQYHALFSVQSLPPSKSPKPPTCNMS